MFEFDPATGVFALPVWMMAVIAVLVVVLAAFSIGRAGATRTVVSIAVICVLGFAGWFALAVTPHAGGTGADTNAERIDERRLFEARVNELVGRAMMPGSPLACLDGNAGDQVAEGCERLIFSGPDTTAAAVSYLSARLAMVSEGTELAAASGLSYDKPLDVLRRGLESDRYGIVAYLMLQNPDCKPENCASLTLMRDANKLRVNLLEKPFDVLVARYAANWQAGGRNVAATDGRGALAAVPPPPAVSGAGVPVSSKYDFPSSASIPPVSIMNAEPTTPPGKTAAAPEAKGGPEAKPAAPSKPAPKRAAAPKPPVRHEAAAPTQLAPAQQASPAAAQAQERPVARQQ